jgi:hypothetical protein
MARSGSVARTGVSSAKVAVVESGGGLVGKQCRGGKVKGQGHYLEARPH